MRSKEYIHQNPDWPAFEWDEGLLGDVLAPVRLQKARMLGRMEMVGFDLRSEATQRIVAEDAVRSSQIEGEMLDLTEVRSSVARRMGQEDLPRGSDQVEGVTSLTIDATQNQLEPLTADRLFQWHEWLFPKGIFGYPKLKIGAWRDGPMSVLSGTTGRERVHFEAPEAELVPAEMAAFLAWFEAESNRDPEITAAIAHLWFITIHPFADGNGRIARAICDMALARAEASGQRFYSLSSQIQKDRLNYYGILEKTQRGGLHITPWLLWFARTLAGAMDSAEDLLSHVLGKARVWKELQGKPLTERQLKVINKLIEGFEGKLTTTKWATLTKTSPDTALRDIKDLVGRGILRKSDAGGRSTSYELADRFLRTS